MRRINGLNSLIVRKGLPHQLPKLPKRNFSDRRNFNEIHARYYFHKNLYFSRIFSLVALGAGIGYQIFHNKVFAQEAQYAPEPEAKTLSKESMPAFALSLLLVQQWNLQKAQQVSTLANLIEQYRKKDIDLDNVISYAKKEKIQIELILMFANAQPEGLISLSELTKKGIKLDHKDEETGLTALHLAVAREKITAYDHLVKEVDKFPRLMTMPDKNGQIPLHYAATIGSTLLISQIIASNPSLRFAKDFQGRIPLYCAPYSTIILNAFLVEKEKEKNNRKKSLSGEQMSRGPSPFPDEPNPQPLKLSSLDELYLKDFIELKEFKIDNILYVKDLIPKSSSETVLSIINHSEKEGLTPLLWVLKNRNEKEIQKTLKDLRLEIEKIAETFLSTGASPLARDLHYNNVIMYSCDNLAILKSVYVQIDKIDKNLHDKVTNLKNKFGYSALMMALHAGNPATVDFLLDKKADISAEGKEDLISPIIVATNCAVGYPEKRPDYLKIIRKLHSSFNGAKLEDKQEKHGLTALMIASQLPDGDEIFEYLYTSIHPNSNGIDKDSYEAKKQQDKALLKKEVEKKKFFLNQLRKKDALMTPKKHRILSIDGGGIRGFIPAVILSLLEEDTQCKISEMFDLIVGTSTGGIIGLGLTVPKDEKEEIKCPEYSAAELADIYYDEKNARKIFTPNVPEYVRLPLVLAAQALFGIISINYPIGFLQSRSILTFLYGFIGAYLSGCIAGIMPSVVFSKYRRDGLDFLLKKYLKETTLDKALTQVMVTSWAKSGNNEIGESKIFDSDSSDCDFKMWQAAAATSAAPTFFDAAFIARHSDNSKKYHVDGGIFANNPIQIGINRLLEKGIKLEDIEVVSIGTGWNGAPLSGVDLFMFFLRQQFQGQGGWVLPLLNIMTESEKVNRQMEALFKNKGNYFRIQLILKENLELDDLSSVRKISEQYNIKREIEQKDQKQIVRFFVPKGEADEIRNAKNYKEVKELLSFQP